MLDIKLTEALKREGLAREIIRNIQEMRRDLGLRPRQTVHVQMGGNDEIVVVAREWAGVIQKEVNAKRVMFGGKRQYRIEREIPFGRDKLWLGIR